MNWTKPGKSSVVHRRPLRALFSCAISICLFGSIVGVKAQTSQTATTFKSPDDAVKALVAAARANNMPELFRILAPEGKRLVSADPVQDKRELARFVARADERTELTKINDTRYTVAMGKDDWSLPIPIVKRGEAWAFDSTEGMHELLLRRVGRNELDTILVCVTYSVAQWDYFLGGDWNNDNVPQFAQRFISTAGKKDGLYWPAQKGEPPSPLGPLVGYAQTQGYQVRHTAATTGEHPPFHGYRMKILKAQGPAAPGGSYSYMINGRMIAGFAMVAYPAEYGSTGVMTFIVSQQGKVYQKDLGRRTAAIAQAMTIYNPDKTWELAEYKDALKARGKLQVTSVPERDKPR